MNSSFLTVRVAVTVSVLLSTLALSRTCEGQGSVRYFGSSCGLQPPHGNPKIILNGTYSVGSVLGAGVTSMGNVAIQYQCYFHGYASLYLGANDQQMGGQPLPFLLPMSLTAGWPCQVLTSSDFLWQTVPLTAWPPGGSFTSLVIPNDPRFLGQKIFFQWAVSYGTGGLNCLPWPGYISYLVTSDAAEVTVGR